MDSRPVVAGNGTFNGQDDGILEIGEEVGEELNDPIKYQIIVDSHF